MSKSKPETSIFVHDDHDTIAKKIGNAYCPTKVVQGNPIMEYSKYIVFRKLKSLRIERPEKYGGNIEFSSYDDLEKAFLAGSLHPADLKKGVAESLDAIVAPIREHFEKDPSANRLYEAVRSADVTR
jgi:tyrosyl-tRNA synthetase